MRERLQRIVIAAVWIAGAALVVMTVRLTGQNRELTAQIQSFFRSIALPAGTRMPALIGFDRTGQEVIVDSTSEDRPVLVLVFSPACPACEDNWPKWNALVSLQREMGGSIVPVDITGGVRDDYLQAHGIASLPVVDSVTPETDMAYRFRFTPQTLIVHRGKLAAGWIGILTDANVAQASDLLAGHVRPQNVDDNLDVVVLPACDGMPCSDNSDCGSRCTCEGYVSTAELGTCVAKPGASTR